MDLSIEGKKMLKLDQNDRSDIYYKKNELTRY